MKKLLLIAALMLVAVPARADTIVWIVDVTVNPLNLPDGMAWLDLMRTFDPADPYAVQLVQTDGPGIMPTFADPYPYSVIVTDFTYVAAVPEPTTWAMLLTGFAMLGGWSWRFRYSF